MSRLFTRSENQAWAHSLAGKMTSACMIIRHADTVLMIKASYKDHWTFPSGIVEPFESPQTTAIRETLEETGVTIDPSNCRFFTVVYTSASPQADRDRFNFAFITDVDNNDIPLLVPNDEIDQAEWVAIGEIANRANNKGSYRIFQQSLNTTEAPLPYQEVVES